VVRPRDRVMSYLRAVGEVRDPEGLASTALAEAVGYPGSSVAFAQLLSAMERSGLIEREVRGRRTYWIGLAGAAAPRSRDDAPVVPARAASARAASGPAAEPDLEPEPAAAPDLEPEPARAAGLDYDELARWLLAEVVRRVTAAPGLGTGASPGSGSTPGPGRAGVLPRPADQPQPGDLAQPAAPAEPGDLPWVVAGLEARLASLESRQRTLQEENTRLAELLTAARQSLAEQQRVAASEEPGGSIAGLDAGTAQLLERLMSSLRGGAARGGGKKTQAG
jgi:hypothetical protein